MNTDMIGHIFMPLDMESHSATMELIIKQNAGHTVLFWYTSIMHPVDPEVDHEESAED